MRRVQAQQTGEPRLDSKPLGGQDAQHMGMSDHKHIVAFLQHWTSHGNYATRPSHDLLHGFAGTGMHLHYFAIGEHFLPIPFERLRQ